MSSDNSAFDKGPRHRLISDVDGVKPGTMPTVNELNENEDEDYPDNGASVAGYPAKSGGSFVSDDTNT